MAFDKRAWKARLGTGLNRFKLTKITGTADTYELENTPVSVTQEGDTLSADNLNDLEQRIYEASVDPDTEKGLDINPTNQKLYIKTDSTLQFDSEGRLHSNVDVGSNLNFRDNIVPAYLQVRIQYSYFQGPLYADQVNNRFLYLKPYSSSSISAQWVSFYTTSFGNYDYTPPGTPSPLGIPTTSKIYNILNGNNIWLVMSDTNLRYSSNSTATSWNTSSVSQFAGLESGVYYNGYYYLAKGKNLYVTSSLTAVGTTYTASHNFGFSARSIGNKALFIDDDGENTSNVRFVTLGGSVATVITELTLPESRVARGWNIPVVNDKFFMVLGNSLYSLDTNGTFEKISGFPSWLKGNTVKYFNYDYVNGLFIVICGDSGTLGAYSNDGGKSWIELPSLAIGTATFDLSSYGGDIYYNITDNVYSFQVHPLPKYNIQSPPKDYNLIFASYNASPNNEEVYMADRFFSYKLEQILKRRRT